MLINEFNKEKIEGPEKIAKIFQTILLSEDEFDREKEHCWVIGLAANNSIKYIDLVSLGNLNSSIVHPREVFRFAILKGVARIILVHNHPSGELKPSKSDDATTEAIYRAGKILGIDLLDHLIISENSFRSYNEYNFFAGISCL